MIRPGVVQEVVQTAVLAAAHQHQAAVRDVLPHLPLPLHPHRDVPCPPHPRMAILWAAVPSPLSFTRSASGPELSARIHLLLSTNRVLDIVLHPSTSAQLAVMAARDKCRVRCRGSALHCPGASREILHRGRICA